MDQKTTTKITFRHLWTKPWAIVPVVAAALPALLGAGVATTRPQDQAKTPEVKSSHSSTTQARPALNLIKTPATNKDFYLLKPDSKMVKIPVNEKIGRANLVLGIGPDANGHPQEVAIDLDFKTGRGLILPDPGCDLDKPACKTDSDLGDRVELESTSTGAMRVRVMNSDKKTAFSEITLTPDAQGKLKVAGNTGRFQNVSIGQVHNDKATVLRENIPSMVPASFNTSNIASAASIKLPGDGGIGYEHCGWYTCKTFLTRSATRDVAQFFDEWDNNDNLGGARAIGKVCNKAPLPGEAKALCFFIGAWGAEMLKEKAKQARDENACLRFMYSRAAGTEFGGGVDMESNNGKHCLD